MWLFHCERLDVLRQTHPSTHCPDDSHEMGDEHAEEVDNQPVSLCFLCYVHCLKCALGTVGFRESGWFSKHVFNDNTSE